MVRELVWVEEGELPISVTAPRIISPADNQTNGFGWIEGNNIYDAGQENICPQQLLLRLLIWIWPGKSIQL